MRRFFRSLTFILSIILAFLFTYCTYISYNLPDNYKITQNCGLYLEKYKFLNAAINKQDYMALNIDDSSKKSYNANILFMNAIPIKTVNIELLDEEKVTPCGIPFGVKIFTQGVLIVGISDIKTENGLTSPAKAAGLKKGDVILSVNDVPVKDNEGLMKAVESSNGEALECEILRNDINFKVQLQPLKNTVDNVYRLGLWVRDSSAGIGTLTFYNEKTQAFAGLGHGICDVDTGELLPLSHGDIVKASVSGIVKGSKGVPGELKGYFIESSPIGTLLENTECGIYGNLHEISSEYKPVTVAMKQQVKTGKAYIVSTISGMTPQCYDIEIQDINYNENLQSKNMVIKITDERLLSQTGGIIQGMSGSPIIQDDMLVGAITHVFVNDPQKGYGIFAENMLPHLKQLENDESMGEKVS